MPDNDKPVPSVFDLLADYDVTRTDSGQVLGPPEKMIVALGLQLRADQVMPTAVKQRILAKLTNLMALMGMLHLPRRQPAICSMPDEPSYMDYLDAVYRIAGAGTPPKAMIACIRNVLADLKDDVWLYSA